MVNCPRIQIAKLHRRKNKQRFPCGKLKFLKKAEIDFVRVKIFVHIELIYIHGIPEIRRVKAKFQIARACKISALHNASSQRAGKIRGSSSNLKSQSRVFCKIMACAEISCVREIYVDFISRKWNAQKIIIIFFCVFIQREFSFKHHCKIIRAFNFYRNIKEVAFIIASVVPLQIIVLLVIAFRIEFNFKAKLYKIRSELKRFLRTIIFYSVILKFSGGTQRAVFGFIKEKKNFSNTQRRSVCKIKPALFH